jgi:coproporphyrinogen III oxidase-like Fe-S oxidoreductase
VFGRSGYGVTAYAAQQYAIAHNLRYLGNSDKIGLGDGEAQSKVHLPRSV